MIEKRLSKKINFIEIYQVIGGVLGLLLTAYIISTIDFSKYQNILGYITVSTPFLFFGFCIYSGILLNKKNYITGLRLIIISLLLQVIAFEMFGLYFSAINGIGIKLTLDLTNDVVAGFDFHPSQFIIASVNSKVFTLRINLVAIAMLFYVSKVYNELKK